MSIFITGAAGFIGAKFVLDWLAQSDEPVFNLDKLTYADNLETLASLQANARHISVQGDIGDSALVASLLVRSKAVLNIAGCKGHMELYLLHLEKHEQMEYEATHRLLPVYQQARRTRRTAETATRCQRINP